MSKEDQLPYCMFVDPRIKNTSQIKHYCTILKKDCIASQKNTYSFEDARDCGNFLEEWADEGIKPEVSGKTK